ncbi:MAG: hypothetical protein AAF907_06595 [Planctomycetota bacterium]
MPLPADLARVVDAWPTLSPAVRAGVLAMVEAFDTPKPDNLPRS